MITITAVVDTAVAEPRIQLAVTSNTTAPAVDPAAGLTIYRTHSDGSRKTVIVEAGAKLIGGSWPGFDYHCPFNSPVTYTAVASSVASSPAAVTLPSAVSWLIHPNNPALSVQLDGASDIADPTYDTSAVLSFPYGGIYPISLTEGVQRAPTGQLTARINSRAKAQALIGLFGDGGPVLMNLASADPDAWYDIPWAWIQRQAITPTNPAKNLSGSSRRFVIPFQVIDTPSGAAVPLWTCDNMTATYATCDAVSAAFTTCAQLTTNTMPTSNLSLINSGGLYAADPANAGLYKLPGTLTPDPARAGLYLLPS